MTQPTGHQQQQEDEYYAEEGRKLLAQVNADRGGGGGERSVSLMSGNSQGGGGPSRYDLANVIYSHPETGAKLYVGNHRAAASMEILSDRMGNCRRIVFCQDKDGTKHFEHDREFRYLTFPIGRWRSYIPWEGEPGREEAAIKFFRPLFEFLDDELGHGNNVLIHCLAGAHRAGTAGISSLMHLTGMSASDATKTAKALRPIIDPIGDFPNLLSLLEKAMIQHGTEKKTTTTTTPNN